MQAGEASSSTLSPAWPSSGHSCIYYDGEGQPHVCYIEPATGAYVDLYTGEVLPRNVPVYREVEQVGCVGVWGMCVCGGGRLTCNAVAMRCRSQLQ